MKRILIVGGGFGGVSAARHLAKKHLKDTEITLLTEKPWLEYYGVLYRLFRDGPLSQACIPLAICLPRSVRTVIDTAVSVDASKKSVKGKGGSAYDYDTLILAPGAEPAYFGIPGLQEHAVTMMNVHAAFGLRADVDRTLGAGAAPQIVVIGAGATGLEASSELLQYARDDAKKKGIDASGIRVDLIDLADRVLPMAEPKASAHVLKRLQSLGINVRLKTAVASADGESVTLSDGTILPATTIVWTAGMKGHSLLGTVHGMEFDKRGRAVVDDALRAKGASDIFVIGDSAATRFSGFAQTAIEHGEFVADAIAAAGASRVLPFYKPTEPAYAIPVGEGWAIVKYLFIRAHGFIGYLLRRAADIHVYMLVMPWRFVPGAFFGTISLKKYGISL